MALLAVIGVVAFRAFTGEGGGAGSPDAAVRNLADAVVRRDVAGALTLLPPGEVRSLKKVYDKATSKAAKAGLLRAADPFAGVDMRIAGLRLQVHKDANDVARVTIQAGAASYAVDDKALQTPIRALIAHSRDESGDEQKWAKGQVELGPTRDRPAITLTTIRQGGRWYVSPTYSLLESWRQDSGLPSPNFGVDLAKVSTGAPTPEAAVNALSTAVQSFDVSKMIDLLSPDELGGAFRRYRQAIVVGTEDYFSDVRRNVSFRVNELQTSVLNKHGGTADVAISSANGTAAYGRDSARWRLEGTCLNVTGSSDRSNECLAQINPEAGSATLADSVPSAFVSVTNHHGKWYVSPVQTLLRYGELLVQKLTDRQALAMFNARQFAKPDGPVAPNGSLKGSLVSGQYGVYTYDVAAPGPVLACTSSGDRNSNVDAALYAPDGRPAQYLLDDIYMAEQTGQYRVVLRPYNPDRAGDFDLTLKALPVQDVSLPGDASGTVGANCDAKVLRFNASAGDHVLIQGKFPGSRPVRVVDAKGHYFSYGRLHSVDTSGAYLLAITDAGDYSIHLERATGNFLTQSARLQGSVVRNGTTEYQLYTPGNERLRIAVTGTSGFDGKMDLLSPSGNVLTSADDTNGKDPAITYQFSAEGVYRVRVSGYQGQSGSFSISVN